ncbi:MafB family polymorphic toxin [Neisseria gonorrhoeae]|uniref:MafB family polymorphic toxin n=6 Tax=Neisseria gonorrhoeae TaxID=485 RepID=UPI0020267593|nr:MafB family polymorphic toxin [Neisseria gonorrhoeae]URK95179.1 MafB family polymorphic toxin [Neisseria gonorrhoeae]
MNLPIQKFMMLFAAAISLLQIPISHANGLDARLRDDMQAKHYEPGGKYHLFGNGRGSVKNRVCAVQTFDATAVGPILPITHERTGFEGVIGYETHFSGHGHEVHSPFDNHDSRSTSDFSGGVDGGFTVYQLHRTGSEIHPADGYDGPQGSDYPPPGGARDIYSYYVKGTSTKTKINTVPQAPFSDRWLKENAGAASGFFSRADEAGKLIWENNPNQNWWGNRMDDVRGIIQGAANPFLTGFQGLGVGAITDSAVNPVTYAAARKTLQGIHDLGNLSPAAQLAAATALQDSAFAVKDGINSARQWADAHPNITATAQTALAVAEAAGTVWGGKKVELNPAKWDWVKNTGYKTPAVRTMHTLDGEMAGGNRPPKSITSKGKANAATYPKLVNQLNEQNLNNIAAQDSRLASAVKDWKTIQPNKKGEINFGIGSATRQEAEQLGKIWVGDGAKPVSSPSCQGCMLSADGTRLYRPPTTKSNTPESLNPTGVQANFVTRSVDGKTLTNGHLNIK